MLWLVLSFAPIYAADFGYQGTHILTHGALEDVAKAFEKNTALKSLSRAAGVMTALPWSETIDLRWAAFAVL